MGTIICLPRGEIYNNQTNLASIFGLLKIFILMTGLIEEKQKNFYRKLSS